MNVILVDARRYGHVLKGARKTVRLDKNDAAKISDSVLTRLFTYGYMLMIARKNIKEKNKIVSRWWGG